MSSKMPAETKFSAQVKQSLDALLNDLHETTEVLKRANLNERSKMNDSAEDKEPIYQPQKTTVHQTTATVHSVASTGLEDLEQLLDDYSQKRTATKNPESSSRPTVESLLTELDDGSERKNQSDNHLADSKEMDFSGMKMPRPAVDAYAGRQQGIMGDSNQLDSMLGSLQSDMSKHGIHTIPKGDCAQCHKTIVGQVVIALGKMWHPEHFLCCHCGEELGHRNFFERAGKAYCESDYHNLFSPRCAQCNGAIKDRCVTALDKTWHPEHFVCAQCGREFGEEGFHEKDGRAFCRQDYFTMFAPKCHGCRRPIQNNYITALNTQWHPECFVCQECKQPFAGGSFFDHEGRLYCERHYHERRGSLCAGCEKPISGRCVTAMGHRFHPEHFLCCFCQRQLNKGTFKEQQGKPYCHKCFEKLLSLS